MNGDVEVSAPAINVPIPEALRWTDVRRGREFVLTTLDVRLLGARCVRLVPVPDREELTALPAQAADRAGQLWAVHRGVG